MGHGGGEERNYGKNEDGEIDSEDAIHWVRLLKVVHVVQGEEMPV
jgi:hypothetical protein